MRRIFLAMAAALALTTAPVATADGQALRVTPQHVQFGKVSFGSFAIETITITNRSSEPVVVSIEGVDVPDDFSPGQPDSTCILGETLLSPGATCTQIVRFDPLPDFEQPEKATLRVTALDPDTGEVISSSLVKLSGRGFTP